MTSLLDTPPPRNTRAGVLGLAGTLGLHGALFGLGSAVSLGSVVTLKVAPTTEMVEVALPEPPPEPQAKPPEPDQPRPAPAAPRTTAPPSPEPPPEATPEAAQAGQILDASPDVVDFGDQFVVGAGAHYAGGTTDVAGTSPTAVRDLAARGAGKPASPPAPPIDRSRPPQLAGGSRWQCPFPIEADDAGIDHAVVTLRVEVDADGRVARVTTTTDPGSGFGREARRCAGSKRWAAGLNREGRAAAAVAIVNVRFDR